MCSCGILALHFDEERSGLAWTAPLIARSCRRLSGTHKREPSARAAGCHQSFSSAELFVHDALMSARSLLLPLKIVVGRPSMHSVGWSASAVLIDGGPGRRFDHMIAAGRQETQPATIIEFLPEPISGDVTSSTGAVYRPPPACAHVMTFPQARP